MQKKRGYISTSIKSIKNRLKLRKIRIENLDDSCQSIVLNESDKINISFSPSYGSLLTDSSEYSQPNIKLYKIKKVICNINSSSFISYDFNTLFMEEFPYINRKQANYSSGFIKRHDEKYAYIEKLNKEDILNFERVLFLGGNGSFNFYHWMIEILPKLLYLDNSILEENRINKVVVNESVKYNKNYKWLLDKCTEHLKDIEIIYVSQDINFYTEKLFNINTFNLTVYNFNYLNKIYKNTTIINTESLKLLESRLTKNISVKNITKNKNIFILRNQDTVSGYNKRNYNENEVFEFFKNKGFLGVYPDKLTLEAQIELFKNAEFIIGPSGASWSNLIFCNSSTKAISWLPKSLKYFDTYATLANLHGVELQFIEYLPIDDSIHGPYNIDLNILKKLYYSMSDHTT